MVVTFNLLNDEQNTKIFFGSGVSSFEVGKWVWKDAVFKTSGDEPTDQDMFTLQVRWMYWSQATVLFIFIQYSIFKLKT